MEDPGNNPRTYECEENKRNWSNSFQIIRVILNRLTDAKLLELESEILKLNRHEIAHARLIECNFNLSKLWEVYNSVTNKTEIPSNILKYFE